MFRVINAMDAPYFGQVLRLRLVSGRTPALKEVKGSRFKGTSPEGEEGTVKITAFPLIGGKPSQARFARTGRLDVIAESEGPGAKVEIQWTLTGPA